METFKTITWFIGMFCIGWVIADLSTPDKYRRGIEIVIERCEVALPRNQHCEPVYGARVAGEE